MITVSIASCLNKPERRGYLDACLKSLEKSFLLAFPDLEILVSFDKFGTDIAGVRCHCHEMGMGHSWNWNMQNAKYDWIVQIEDDWEFRFREEVPDVNALRSLILNQIDVLRTFGGLYSLESRDTTVQSWYKSGHREGLLPDGFLFSELNRPTTEPLWRRDLNMYFYSNHPHLKHKLLHERVGGYIENAPPHIVEETMCEKYYNSHERIFFNRLIMFFHIGKVKSRL